MSIFTMSAMQRFRLQHHPWCLHNITISPIWFSFLTILPILSCSAQALPLFCEVTGTLYSINHQNSPTASLYHGHYLFTDFNNNLASKPLHQEKVINDKHYCLQYCQIFIGTSNSSFECSLKNPQNIITTAAFLSLMPFSLCNGLDARLFLMKVKR